MKRIFNLILTLVGFLFLSTAMAQKIDFTIRFNATTSEYEVYGRPDFSAATFNVGGGTQITVVLPKSIADAPLTITSVSGGVWVDNSQVYAPTAAPNSDFHGVSTTGAPIAWVAGQEKLLYKFTLTGGCVSGVRLFENASDPQSDAPGMLFGDFNNYMGNALNFADVYQSNYDNAGIICDTNQPPLATDDITQTPQDTPVSGNVLPNDLDPEGGVLTVSTTPTTPPTKGTVVLNADGSYTYTPNPGVTGTDKFCYQVCDNGSPSKCDTACVTISILGLQTLGNNKPVATDDNSRTYQDTPVGIVVKANDYDPDASGTPNGTLGAPTKLSDPVNGTVVFNADGTVTYTPTTGFVGKDSFT
ncbi:Ig-like domain-containing protein, partial [Runella salmonicolor]